MPTNLLLGVLLTFAPAPPPFVEGPPSAAPPPLVIPSAAPPPVAGPPPEPTFPGEALASMRLADRLYVPQWKAEVRDLTTRLETQKLDDGDIRQYTKRVAWLKEKLRRIGEPLPLGIGVVYRYYPDDRDHRNHRFNGPQCGQHRHRDEHELQPYERHFPPEEVHKEEHPYKPRHGHHHEYEQ